MATDSRGRLFPPLHFRAPEWLSVHRDSRNSLPRVPSTLSLAVGGMERILRLLCSRGIDVELECS